MSFQRLYDAVISCRRLIGVMCNVYEQQKVGFFLSKSLATQTELVHCLTDLSTLLTVSNFEINISQQPNTEMKNCIPNVLSVMVEKSLHITEIVLWQYARFYKNNLQKKKSKKRKDAGIFKMKFYSYYPVFPIDYNGCMKYQTNHHNTQPCQ